MFTCTYDSIGNRLTQTEIDGSIVTFAYDSIYQLINENRSGSPSFQYNVRLVGYEGEEALFVWRTTLL